MNRNATSIMLLQAAMVFALLVGLSRSRRVASGSERLVKVQTHADLSATKNNHEEQELGTTGLQCDASVRGDILSDSMCQKLAELAGGQDAQCRHMGILPCDENECRTMCGMSFPPESWFMTKQSTTTKVVTKQEFSEDGFDEDGYLFHSFDWYVDMAKEHSWKGFKVRSDGGVEWTETVKEYQNHQWNKFCTDHAEYFTDKVCSKTYTAVCFTDKVCSNKVYNYGRVSVEMDEFLPTGLADVKSLIQIGKDVVAGTNEIVIYPDAPPLSYSHMVVYPKSTLAEQTTPASDLK